ncbi:MAG TPA: SLATT domain-containing protein [Cyclobacteriaceae bacterium]|nr:SLATT domain-containing protein [Cyclobacteriaceae bacterium]
MENNEKPKWPKSKDHLNKTFLEELGHKMWNTKGVRFGASQKFLNKNSWSNLSLGFLSAYLIIYGLFSVYQISGSIILDERIIAFSSTTISILLLVFTQYESAQDYKIRALEFHKCSLEISELHDEIRLFKTIGQKTDEEKAKFCESLNKRYQKVLHSYSNHEEIDYQIFTAKNSKYYDLSRFQVAYIYIKYYVKTLFLYHLLIAAPIIFFVLLFF